MKRVFVCALALGAFACSSGSESTGSNAIGGGSGVAATQAGGSSGNLTNVNGSVSNDTGGIANAGVGGAQASSTGGVASTGAGGAKNTGTGGSSNAGVGGAKNTSTGDTATTGIGGAKSTGGTGSKSTGIGGAKNTGVGGTKNTGTGGVENTSIGGKNTGGVASTAVGGTKSVGGTSSTNGTNPLEKDVTAAVSELAHYYVSNDGDDTKSGTSPEEAWKSVSKIPKDKSSAVFFEKGGTFKLAGAPARGRNGPAAFNVPKGSVWTSYGSGDARPILYATEQVADTATGAVLSPGGNTVLSGLSFTGQANFGLLIETDGNTVQDCEIDGNIPDSLIQLGFSVRGHNNLIAGNYIHSLHVVILDSGDVNTSGGAEAIVVNGTDQEIAYNKIVDCWTPNETLGGAEGGCLEVIARAPGEVVENIYFHHNYCERAVGLFEACSGNFAGTAEKVQENHAVLRNSVLAYNVVVDAMWLYLLQTANTDMQDLVFEHNTLIHGPANTDIPQKGAPGFGNFYDTDVFIPSKSCSAASDCSASKYAICLNGSCYYQAKAQPGQITVRNNLFVVLEGATAATMKLPPGPDDVVNNIFSPKAPQGMTASAGKVTVVSDPGLVNTFRLAPSSPAIDKGGSESVKPWTDFDGKTVPCGTSADVGAIEYCP